MATTRIDRFVDWFIRSSWVGSEWSDLGSDRYIDDPDRADRCDTAAENGADGSTHREVITDWRNAFQRFVRDHKHSDYPRFESAVIDHFDATEQWHISNGSIDREIG